MFPMIKKKKQRHWVLNGLLAKRNGIYQKKWH